MLVNRNEEIGGSEFCFKPVNLWYANDSFNKIYDRMDSLDVNVKRINNNSNILESGYYSGLANVSSKKYNLVLEKLNSLKSNFDIYKARMMALDPSLENLFLYMEYNSQNMEIDDSFISDFYNLSPVEQKLKISEIYRDLFSTNAENYNNEIKKLEGLKSNFYNGYDSFTYFQNLIGNDYQKYVIIDESGIQIKSIEQFRNEIMSSNPYATPNEINESVAEYSKMMDEVFSIYMKDKYGKSLTFNEYDALITDLESNFAAWDNSRYGVEQDIRALKFEVDYPLDENEVYSGGGQISAYYLDDDVKFKINGVDVDWDDLNPMQALKYLNDEKNVIYYSFDLNTYMSAYYGFYDSLTDDQINNYNLYYEKYGRAVADQYFDSIKDTINQQYASDLVKADIDNALRENGTLRFGSVFIDGVEVGVEGWLEGINNAFHADGVRTVSQYEQMYYMQYLTNSAGLYLQDLIEDCKNTKGEQYALNVYNQVLNKDGSINFSNFKKYFPDNYDLLQTKNSNDKKNRYQFAYEMGGTVGNMLPATVLAILTNGVGAPAITLGGQTVSIASMVSQAAMGLSVFGNSKNQALIDGASREAAWLFAALSATSEVGLSMLLGNIPGLNDSAELSLKGLLSEGTEELLQEYIGAGLEAVVLGKRIDLSELNAQAAKSFLYGVLLSGGMNLGNYAINSVGLCANISMNGQKINLTDVNSVLTLMSAINNNEINYVDLGGINGFAIYEDANVDYSKYSSLFPDAAIAILDKNGKIIGNVVDGKVVKAIEVIDSKSVDSVTGVVNSVNSTVDLAAKKFEIEDNIRHNINAEMSTMTDIDKTAAWSAYFNQKYGAVEVENVSNAFTAEKVNVSKTNFFEVLEKSKSSDNPHKIMRLQEENYFRYAEGLIAEDQVYDVLASVASKKTGPIEDAKGKPITHLLDRDDPGLSAAMTSEAIEIWKKAVSAVTVDGKTRVNIGYADPKIFVKYVLGEYDAPYGNFGISGNYNFARMGDADFSRTIAEAAKKKVTFREQFLRDSGIPIGPGKFDRIITCSHSVDADTISLHTGKEINSYAERLPGMKLPNGDFELVYESFKIDSSVAQSSIVTVFDNSGNFIWSGTMEGLKGYTVEEFNYILFGEF